MRIIAILIAAITLSACAVGNKVDFTAQPAEIKVSSDKQVPVIVEDSRAYVLSGDKTPDFVGLRRGGFGNPFDVSTGTGRSFASEVAEALVAGLKNNGVDARVVTTGTDVATIATGDADGTRIMKLTVVEWKTDIYFGMEVEYDLVLKVFDGTGRELATSSVQGSGEKISEGNNAAFEAGYARVARATLSQKLQALLEAPEIAAALN